MDATVSVRMQSVPPDLLHRGRIQRGRRLVA
jgi:hypothetical protein